jgi:flagellar protein FlaJ
VKILDLSKGRYQHLYKKTAVGLFGGVADKYMKYFEHLKPKLLEASMQVLLKTWICIIIMTAVLSLIVSVLLITVLFFIFAFDSVLFIIMLVSVPPMTAALVFFIFYIYPIQKAERTKNSIDTNLPFALAHINAIASSGIPPEYMFEMLTESKEYGEIAKQANLIVRNIKMLGMSSVAAMNSVAERTPSPTFKQVLTGISTTMEKGGNIVRYIGEMTDKALFDYRIKREKYLKTLSTYADIYTALLVAAPLMLLSVLGIMSIIGGTILGLTIEQLIILMTWVVMPALNISFLAFIHMTYPGV